MSFDSAHWFWWLLTAAALLWYSTITVYIAFKGAMDIKHMLARLKASGEEQQHASETRP